MLKAKRVLILIAIVLCVMQLLGMTVQVIRPKKEARQVQWGQMLQQEEKEVVRKTLVWYLGGLIFLAVAITMEQPQALLQLSFGVAGVAALLVGHTGGGLSGRAILWPRFGLSFLTLAILIIICVRLSRVSPEVVSAPVT
jgi:hypothetical protein